MIVKAAPDEGYCLKTNVHSPSYDGSFKVCYRCGMLLGLGGRAVLGSLLDY